MDLCSTYPKTEIIFQQKELNRKLWQVVYKLVICSTGTLGTSKVIKQGSIPFCFPNKYLEWILREIENEEIHIFTQRERQNDASIVVCFIFLYTTIEMLYQV